MNREHALGGLTNQEPWMINSRRKIVAAFGIAEVPLIVASAAFACTTFLGDLTASTPITPAHAATSQKVTGDGSGMSNCGGSYTPVVKFGNIASGTAHTTGTDTLTLATAKSTTCGNTQLTASGTLGGTYTTRIIDSYMPQGGGSGTNHNCHGASSGTVLDSNGTVTNGVWKSSAGSNALTFTRGVGSKNVCIYVVGGVLNNADAIAINFDVV